MKVEIVEPTGGERKASIKCDEIDCDWRSEIKPSESLYEQCKPFVNLPCPKCNKGVLITEQALAEAHHVDFVIARNNKLKKELEELGIEGLYVGVKLNSSK